MNKLIANETKHFLEIWVFATVWLSVVGICYELRVSGFFRLNRYHAFYSYQLNCWFTDLLTDWSYNAFNQIWHVLSTRYILNLNLTSSAFFQLLVPFFEGFKKAFCLQLCSCYRNWSRLVSRSIDHLNFECEIFNWKSPW